ncbi:MAG: carotenoid oxygenase family protein [Alphaproteobacteria bacterium]
MAKPFPTDNIFLNNNFAPVRMESDAPDLIIEGEIPRELHGVLHRNSPNPQYAPWSQHHHWFMGDGMIHAFHIEDGKISYRNRWVRTEKFKHERKLGEAVIATDFADIMNQDPRAEGIPLTVANTNALMHAGKLLALEEASPATAMDPITLETLGPIDFEGGYDGPVTAHPKVDPNTGELIFFGAMANGPGSPEIAYNVADKNGKLTEAGSIMGPYGSMIHDFMVSRDHVAMPVMPASIDIEAIFDGGDFIQWKPELGNHIGVFSRKDGPDTARWFTNEASYVFHTLNMFEEDGKVIADVLQFDRLPLFDDPTAGEMDMGNINSALFRWTFDLNGNTDTYKAEQLDDFFGEFPRYDERFFGQKHKYGYFAIRTAELDDAEGPFDTILARNFETGHRDEWVAGEGCYIQEPVFVPRSDDAPEGDGWILTVAWDRRTNTSDLVILNALDVASGPVGRAKLPTRVPYGFHGNWHPLS